MNDGLGDLPSFSNKENRRADPRRQSTAIFSSFATETRGSGLLNVDDELYLRDEDILLPLSKAIGQHSHDNPGGGTLWLDPDLDDEILTHNLPDLPEEEEEDKEAVHVHNNAGAQQQHQQDNTTLNAIPPKTSPASSEPSKMETLLLDEDDESFLLKDENKVKEMAILFKMSSMEVSDTIKEERRLSSHPLPDFLGPTDEGVLLLVGGGRDGNEHSYVEVHKEEEKDITCHDNDDRQNIKNKEEEEEEEEEEQPSIEVQGDDNQNINADPSNSTSPIKPVTTKSTSSNISSSSGGGSVLPVVQKEMPRTTTRSKLKPPTVLSRIKAHRPLGTRSADGRGGGGSNAVVEEGEMDDDDGPPSPSTARLRFLEQNPELVFGGGSKKVENSPNGGAKNGGGEGNVKRRTALERQWMEWNGQPL